MAKRTTSADRRAFYEHHLAGMSYEAIAIRRGCSRECVRYWCRRQRDGDDCRDRYQRTPAGLLSRFDPKVRYCILRLRRAHPRWGPASILVQLRKRPSLRGLTLPSVAAIGRYLHQWPGFRRARPRRTRTAPRPCPVGQVHERWQVDFKVRQRLADGTLVHLFTVYDQYSGACMNASVETALVVQHTAAQVQESQVRAFLRAAFARRQTLPDAVQTDSEPSLVGRVIADAFPSRFTLWLVGLGIDHVVIRPGRPTDNAEVERGHRTLDDYVLTGNRDKTAPQLQTLMEQALVELLYERPSRGKACRGRPPVVAYPELLAPRRSFSPQSELSAFDLQRVDSYLATFTWQRRVGKNGQVVIGRQRTYSIGRPYGGRTTLVRFDPADRHFVFRDADAPSQLLARRPVRGLELSDILDIAPWPLGMGVQQLPLPLAFAEG